MVNSCQVSKFDNSEIKKWQRNDNISRGSLAIAFSFRNLANIIIMVITDFFKSIDFEKNL